VARILIVGCGCRGQELARALAADGHAVRGTTRDRARFEDIAAAGAEPVLADPDLVGTLVSALDAVAIVVWLLGRATGPPEQLAALHGERLRALFAEFVDTTVRGVVLEPAGESDIAIAQAAEATWAIPVVILEGSAREAVQALLDSAGSQ
jgi:3-hydroxyisobutyrate dehydrogenase-like beta-hydroxyacid dehydrogenase